MTTRSKYVNQVLNFYDSVSPQERVFVMAPVKIFDDFLGKALDTTNDWTVAGVNSGTAAISAAIGGTMRITTGAADDDDVDVASDLIWEASKACCLEVRIANNDVDKLAFNVGFSDATGEGADLIAMMYSGTTLTSTATDFAGFLWDPDADTDYVYCVAVKAGVDKSVISTAQALTDGAYVVLRVELDESGNADYYVNGVHKGSHVGAITTTTDLCIYVAVINHGESAANTADVDYIKAWQKR